ncbi:Mus7/MMS22 family-domain-containing protein [Apiosordaria backusii]|uniref:Mus7/MMS22 family-domain-containing protein n=1 Tax=Apiosordaria backusii TaxID=314023 RepID=A0AA40ELR9_9PEZI|nr:Mus7/MMS22 family-domain-containing protein [Apiosordaria backusii]
MRNWRELGEVPDSDDDSFDDTDYNDLEIPDLDLENNTSTDTPIDASATATTATTAVNQPAQPQKNDDIWDFPGSSPGPTSSFVFQTQKPPSPITKPASSPEPEPTAAKQQQKIQIPLPAAPNDGTYQRFELANSPESTEGATKEQGFLEDEISTSYLRVTTSRSTSPLSSPLSSPPSILSRTPTPPGSPARSRRVPSSPHNRETPAGDEDELARRTAVGLERSLRPRKPIQQHPYMIENVRYTSFMKSHGVKPIKVLQASQSARRAADDEDSQEQEYQAEEESLEASGGGPLHDTEESGPMLFDNDDDELALSPSTSKPSPGHPLRTSSQQTPGTQTDATSISGDEEFPPLDRLQPAPRKRGRPRKLKRQLSGQLSARKRLRIVPDSSPGSSPQRAVVPPVILPPVVWNVSSSPPDFPNQQESTPRNLQTVDSPIIINEDDRSDISDAESNPSRHTSDSESDVIRETSKRIRGVLPASWLRLNQPNNQPKPVRQPRRSPEPLTEQPIRRGVALPKPSTQSRPPASTQFPLFDDSDDSESAPAQRPTLTTGTSLSDTENVVMIEDDAGSVVEEDFVDWMLPGKKRSGSYSTSGRAKKQKSTTGKPVFRGVPGQHMRQPKITQALGRSKHSTSSTTKKGPPKPRRREGNSSHTKQSIRKRAVTPPLLSILDVLEPDAPKFIKIAARTVRKRPDLGKDSPTQKSIRLANRRDNVDALSTIQDWKSGKTKPRVTAPAASRAPRPKPRAALEEISTNPAPRRQQGPGASFPRKLVRQTGLDSFVTVEASPASRELSRKPSVSRPKIKKPVPDRGPQLRPAQLEEDEDEDVRQRLAARKRKLDAYYRRAGAVLNLPATDGLGRPLGVDFTLRELAHQSEDEPPTPESPPEPTTTPKRNPKSRYRKKQRPQQIDIEAPQYTRANDPLPAAFTVVEQQQQQQIDQAATKLQGLGPYGSHYTQHFDIFPLDMGVFFHESTLLGRGLVRKAVEPSLAERIRHQKASSSFVLDQQTLRWSMWDDQTSSELGILVDLVSDQLAGDLTESGLGSQRPVEAADFILKYILESLSIDDETRQKAFVSRCLEVFSSFVTRLDSASLCDIPERNKTEGAEVASRFCVALLAVRSISQAGIDLMQTMKIEDLLKKLALATVTRLLNLGLEDLRDLYGDLQHLSFRERGIRSDRALVHCWVVLMRVLENANIPRSGLWDIVHAAQLNTGVDSGQDAQAFEYLWQDMFTLLPLTEIDDSGILIAGMRKTAPIEGWLLPRKLMDRVFGLYKSNPRQSPSFNEYCRALVARCHFLVQQWGWRKCTAIIGTIFDFFGSQNLENLRNEEVYKSPQFLEELDRSPSLMIEPEDRCFHIFIKLLALAIQRLKQFERTNDIRNLVARTLPNHNRQYLKEDTIHQHDLAALRNHHDLLCTLFWVAPPDLRPGVHLIEKLVIPASAHKEACLINIRAWNQLARFVIVKNEGRAAFEPFRSWRNNVFNQVLDQYLSAASDIEQQFRDLSSEMMAGITKEMKDEMIVKNKTTALDVLFVCLKASLDVLQRAPSLEAAIYGLNTPQLQKTFTSLDFQSPGFDWGILRVAIDTLDHFMNRIDEASEEHYSSDFMETENADSSHVEEAVLWVNENLTRDFFWMTRTVMGLPQPKSFGRQTKQAACVEKVVTLGARVASRLVNNRVTPLSAYFTPGKHAMFSDLPKKLNTQDRKYLPLFIATLLKNSIYDFKDLGLSILGLWVLSILQPFRLLCYENYLAEVLKSRGFPFLERIAVSVGSSPNYNANLDYFAAAIHYMRKTLREAGLQKAKEHREEFSKILQLGMQKIKDDLAFLRLDTDQPNHQQEHERYISFVRQVISLIKSHGVGICPPDPFFTQPSLDYSPGLQDPQLHTAGIVAYGVRLGEKDSTAVPQLFHYLWNNFKVAIGNNKLEQETTILTRAMKDNTHVRSFMLEFMLPAVVQACCQESNSWILLEVYVTALGNILTPEEPCCPKELTDEGDIEHATALVRSGVKFVKSLTREPSLSQLHLLSLLIKLANTLRPSLIVYLYNSTPTSRFKDELESTMDDLDETLANLMSSSSSSSSSLSFPSFASSSGVGAITLGNNPRIATFTKQIVGDVRRDWVVSSDFVAVKMAGVGGGHPSSSSALGRMMMGSSSGIAATHSQPLVQGVTRSTEQERKGVGYAPFVEGEVVGRVRGEGGRWLGGWIERGGEIGQGGGGEEEQGGVCWTLGLIIRLQAAG